MRFSCAMAEAEKQCSNSQAQLHIRIIYKVFKNMCLVFTEDELIISTGKARISVIFTIMPGDSNGRS